MQAGQADTGQDVLPRVQGHGQAVGGGGESIMKWEVILRQEGRWKGIFVISVIIASICII